MKDLCYTRTSHYQLNVITQSDTVITVQMLSKTDTITAVEAEELLKKDVTKYADGVTKLVKVAINQNQFDALCSFSYNLGIGALATSSLLKFLNAGNFIQASKEFDAWVHAGGNLLQGSCEKT
jgi:lysozyme